MKRLLLFLVLAALSVSCSKLRSVKGLSTEPATWTKPGTWYGRTGTAVTIQMKGGTDQFKSAHAVTFRFDGGLPHGPKGGQWGTIFDYTVPVLKREPHALTLFFWNGDPTNKDVLEELPNQVKAGTLVVIPCIPERVCG